MKRARKASDPAENPGLASNQSFPPHELSKSKPFRIISMRSPSSLIQPPNNSTSVYAGGLIAILRMDKLNVYVFDSRRRSEMAFTMTVAAEMRQLISQKGHAVGVFDSSPSQGAILEELVKAEGIEWTRVIGFHFDEHLGVGENAPRSHRRFLIDRLVKQVPMAEFHGLRGEA